MDFNRLKQLSKEIDFINAILLKDKSLTFDSFFEDEIDLSEEFKIDKICEMIYKILNTCEGTVLEEVSRFLEEKVNEYFKSDKIGAFFIDFIKMNISKNDIGLEERLNELIAMDYDSVPMCQLKIDYLQLTLSLLLNQQALNIELINDYNNNLKSLMAKYSE